MSSQDARDRLLKHFANGSSDRPHLWSQLWDKGDFLPWDRGMPNPALEDVLADRQDLIGTCFKQGPDGQKQRKKALVPGCGRGYDVLLLASFGYDAYGLEASEKAVELCVQEQKTNGQKYPAKDESAGSGSATFLQGDFFSDGWAGKIRETGFDLIYDYTFLCALPPNLRPSWALRQTQLLAIAPPGNLVCVEFPTYKDPKTKGPPFGLRPDVYVEHLSHPGKEVPYDNDGHVKEGILTAASSEAFERIAHWQPERTHEVGKGTDWVSIWRHK